MENVSIYEFKDFKNYLDWVRRKPLTLSKRPLTYQLWAKRLGYKSPRIVGMVFKGQRLPSGDMLERLGRILKLSREEQRYLTLLVRLERQKNHGKDFRTILEDLEELNPSIKDHLDVDTNIFSYIADWYHVAIRQLIGTHGFKEDARWVRERLRDKVTENQITRAIEVMLKLGFIKRNSTSNKLELTHQTLRTSQDIPSAAIQLHHTQMMERAREALTEQAVLKREFFSLAFKFNPERLEEAKKAIRQFRDSFDKKFCATEGTNVYQLNIQLFEHTQSEKGKKP